MTSAQRDFSMSNPYVKYTVAALIFILGSLFSTSLIFGVISIVDGLQAFFRI